MKKRLAKLTAITLAASMVAGSVVPGMTCVAAPTNQTSDRETCNAQLSKEAAVEGIVLLENEDNALPLAEKSSAAVFGTGTYGSIKGGTGSGDVYNRYTVTVYDGLKSVYSISNQAWWDNYVKTWEEKKAQAASERTSNDYVIYKRGSFGGADSFLPIDQPLTQEDMDAAKADGTTTAFYTISRVSGEGSDRSIDKGEYYLSDVERANLELMAANFDKTVVLLNVGGIVDTKFYDEIADLDGLVLVSQSGMESGNAIADILTGKETPSGKLSDTWAVNYEDYPASATIGANDGDTAQEDYTEGIYVGYRYFDSFNVTPAYEFGYGLSYTDFEMTPVSVAADENQVTVTVNVKNVGEVYSGKEVIEVYFSAPDGELEKPYQELAAFAKTDELAPGESQEIQISYNTTEMSSYSEEKAAYIMEDGDYLVRVGNSSRNTQVAAVLTLGEEVVTEQLSNQLEVDREFEELSAAGAEAYSYDAEAAEIELAAKITLDASAFVTENNASAIDEEAVVTYMTAEKAEGYTPTENETVEIVDALPEGSKLIDVYNGTVSMESFVASLTDKQLANIVNGSSGASTEDMEDWGSEANSVAGAAGETTALYGASLGIPNTVEADGPAGIRVTANTTDSEGNAVYNYCTAFPIGTCLAQTWNTELLTRVGEALGEEMAEIGVTLWLAPGMNIHRDPLCGRNFEYYSEDPALTGYVGSCITAGVQSNKGVGVTIKHYISNNQETNRNGVNTSISERAVREIYLKGFEMTVKSAQPMAIMTSYNKVNGVYACENFDLVTSIPRGEWGFDGMVMTDWGAGGRASIDGQMHAGNDLVMPGRTQQRVMDALAGTPSNALDSTLILGDVQKCAASVLTMIMRSLQFGRMYDSVDVQAHTSTYDDLTSYSSVLKSSVKSAAVNNLEDKVAELEEKAAQMEAELGAQAAEVQEMYEQLIKAQKELTAVLKADRTEREERNAELSKEAAIEGIVLLENENNVLPLAAKSKAAVFGTGTYGSIKGGTGSGDVYNKYTVTIYDGLEAAYDLSNQEWWDNYMVTWEAKKDQAARERQSNDYVIYKRGSFGGADSFLPIDQALTQVDMNAAKAGGAKTAFYTISRVSGEGADRAIAEGEYYLSDVERANLELISANFENVIVLLNVGGIVDTKFFDEIEGLDGLVLVSQAGMEGGNAIADILTGKETPSGKLSDTWAVNYEDYPASATIGANDGDTAQEDYTEGIYVGYRYFDSFGIAPAYEFGYGLSYTDFEIETLDVTANEKTVDVTVNVTNTGSVYSGKEVVEVYFSAPDGELEKPYQELAAFAKTDELAPGESQKLTISYNTTEMSSYSEEKAAYIMEDGDYIVRVGNSSRNTKAEAVLTLAEDVITEQLSNQLEVDREFEELSAADAVPYTYDTEAAEVEAAKKIALDASAFVTENNASTIDEVTVTTYLTADDAKNYTKAENEKVEIVEEVPEGTKLIDVYNGDVSMESFVASLTDKQLANIVNGSSGASTEDMEDWGSEANSVAGAAGETTALYGASLGIPNTVEADGPAGIRVTAVTQDEFGNNVYRYCTAFPIGTCLAQSWNVDLLTEVGEAIGEEMAEIGVTLWLAPGMNIHRDPLCGRNFEYYSEDPALTGYVGSCITAGVQSNKGVGVTIKHYISNNQETNRNGVNTSISERAVREIYLKGFEMTVKSAQPMAIMTSYNKVNGVYACENFDLVTSIPRGEWGFDGMVMTDWGAGGRASIDGQMHAGNDLVMPGRTQQRVMDALAGTPSNKLDSNLILGDVQKCAASVLTMIMRSLQFGRMYDSVEVQAHTSTYNDLVSYRAESKEAVQTKAFNDLAAEAEKKAEELENLKSDLAAKDEASAAEKAKLEELEKTLAELQSKLEALENKGGTQEETSEEETFKKQTVTLKKAKSKKKRRATLVWKKVTGADGYVVKLARNKKFKKSTVVEIAKANAKKTTIKKLARKKKYYVCVSAYKVINGKKVYTEYSNVMTVKVK